MYKSQKDFCNVYLNCRRGMLELDLILLNFLENNYINLNINLKNEFNELLKESDQIMYAFLIKEAPSKKYCKILHEINNSKKYFKFN